MDQIMVWKQSSKEQNILVDPPEDYTIQRSTRAWAKDKFATYFKNASSVYFSPQKNLHYGIFFTLIFSLLEHMAAGRDELVKIWRDTESITET